jgi:CRP-like cAMP-binding protein
MDAAAWGDLEPRLEIVECCKGDRLAEQGSTDMEQLFILHGILKRVVASAGGKELILRFTAATDMDSFYAAWRLGTPVPYSIVALTKTRIAKLPMAHWLAFLERHSGVKARFEHEVLRLMSEVMAHAITLHLLDAPKRLARFRRKHHDYLGRIPDKELASYLNLAPETFSRLKQRAASRP